MAPEKQKPTKSESSSSTAASAQETSASKPITITSSALEEDDEFEDFPVDGACVQKIVFLYFPFIIPFFSLALLVCFHESRINKALTFLNYSLTDWQPEDSEAQTNNGPAQEHLWEESWDDDDAADDFSNQLRYERCENKCLTSTII